MSPRMELQEHPQGWLFTVSIAAIVCTIEKDFRNTSWRNPSSNEISSAIYGLKQRLPAHIIETPPTRGANYGFRISVPPQNITFADDDPVR